jgi:hypothetical protein
MASWLRAARPCSCADEKVGALRDVVMSRGSAERFDRKRVSAILSPKDLFEIAAECERDFGASPWYRGHEDAEWDLSTTVARNTAGMRGKRERRQREHALFLEFQRRAPSRVALSTKFDDTPAWMALM